MALSNLSKMLIAGGAGIATIGVGIAATKSKSLTTADKILNWERENGGCRVSLAVNFAEGKLYRPGETSEGLTEVQLKKALEDMTENTTTRDENKKHCQENKGKRLVLAHKLNKWTKDDQNWDTKVPEQPAA